MTLTRGKLVAIEGIDGSGKRTQVALLEKALAARGYSVFSTGFPQYDSWFGKLVGKFLNGDLGPLETVDPRFAALLYAGDRFEGKSNLEAALHTHHIVLADRYIGSNLAHQTARVPIADRPEFLAWVEHLEYTVYSLPRESVVVYLRVPPREAQKLVALKSARTYTSAKHDLQEASLRHLEDAAEMFDLLSRRPLWATVQCFDAMHGNMRHPAEIAEEVLSAIEPLLTHAALASPG
ncbi:MAG: thymidylate kinase [Steroidobacteraceae bacterium]